MSQQGPPLLFESDDERKAWDGFAAGAMTRWGDDAVLIADKTLLARRERDAHQHQGLVAILQGIEQSLRAILNQIPNAGKGS